MGASCSSFPAPGCTPLAACTSRRIGRTLSRIASARRLRRSCRSRLQDERFSARATRVGSACVACTGGTFTWACAYVTRLWMVRRYKTGQSKSLPFDLKFRIDIFCGGFDWRVLQTGVHVTEFFVELAPKIEPRRMPLCFFTDLEAG